MATDTVTLALTEREGLILRRMLETYARKIRMDADRRATWRRKMRVTDEASILLEAEAHTLIFRLHASLTEQGVPL